MNDKLMGRHMDSIQAIVADMERIRLTEKGVAGTDVEPNWEMALALLDVVRSGIREAVPSEAGKGATTSGPKANTTGSKGGKS
jgi:hypothetical protein